VEVLGWVGSALLVYSVLQTRILRLRLFNGKEFDVRSRS
jgi:hypothetical protein